jgi:hypothetical protein
MDRYRRANLALVLAATAILVPSCAAQSSEVQRSVPYPVKPVPADSAIPYPANPVPSVQTLSPFNDNSSPSAMGHFIVYRSEEQMNAADRALAAKRQPAIRAAAVLAGMEFDKAQWSYRQLECQAVPNHLFLLFENIGGAGDVSLFSASIPRSGNGHLRIVPVARRGFSLFSPAPVNALAIAAFNRIRAEEPNGPPPDWLSTSLCYAALTEPRLEIALSPHQASDTNLALSFPPSLEVGQQGESTVRFVNVAIASQPMQWALTFDARSQLVKVEHFPTPVYATRIIPKN